MSDPIEKVTEQGEKVIEQTEKSNRAAAKSNRAAAKSNRAEQKSNQAPQKSNQVRLTAKQRKVLEFCDVVPHTAQEILEMVGVQYHTKTLEQYVNKLVGAGLLRPTGAKIHDSNRRYITAHNEK